MEKLKQKSFTSEVTPAEFTTAAKSSDDARLSSSPDQKYIGGVQTVPYLINAFSDELRLTNNNSKNDMK